MGGKGGWGVPTEYLVAPVLNWTGLGCNKKITYLSIFWINRSDKLSYFSLLECDCIAKPDYMLTKKIEYLYEIAIT